MKSFKQMLAESRKTAAKEQKLAAAAPVALTKELQTDAELIRLAGQKQGGILNEKRTRADVAESEYWFAVAFESRAQKLAVLAALKLPVSEDKYISGVDLIRALKLNVPEQHVPRRRLRSNLHWSELAND